MFDIEKFSSELSIGNRRGSKIFNEALQFYFRWLNNLTQFGSDFTVVQKYYGLQAGVSPKRMGYKALFFAERITPFIEEIEAFVQKNGRKPKILDLGCGYGLESAFITSQSNAQTLGLDAMANKISMARKIKEKMIQNSPHLSHLDFQESSIFKFSPPEPFDLIYSAATLHHIEPAKDAAFAISRLLKPEGTFYLSEENGGNPIYWLLIRLKMGLLTPIKELRVNPHNGDFYYLGNENIRPAFLWKKIFEPARFNIKAIRYSRFLPPLGISTAAHFAIDSVLAKIPFIRSFFGVGLTITLKAGK